MNGEAVKKDESAFGLADARGLPEPPVKGEEGSREANESAPESCEPATPLSQDRPRYATYLVSIVIDDFELDQLVSVLSSVEPITFAVNEFVDLAIRRLPGPENAEMFEVKITERGRRPVRVRRCLVPVVEEAGLFLDLGPQDDLECSIRITRR